MNSDFLSRPRTFVPYWFQSKNLKVKGFSIQNGENKDFEFATVLNAMWLDYKEAVAAYNAEQEDEYNMRGFPERDLSKALEEFLEVKRLETLNEAKISIRCTGENLEELKRFLVAMTGKCDEMEVAVLAHLLWQVKRKMFNKKVSQHLMVVVKSPQEAGKTEAVKRLFNVIKPWFNGASLREITDDRWKFFFKTSYVIFCDELQHAEWASVDALKNIITSEDFATRKLGGNIYSVVTQNCTFVGATNRSVGEIIRDPTGMRRFFELTALPKMDWDVINSTDILKIWQGIDENRDETYIKSYKKQIEARQAELILFDAEDEFISQFQLLSGSNDARTEFVNNSDLYLAYSIFVKRNGERQKPSNSFHRIIKGKGVESDRTGKSGKKGYRVTKESAVLISDFKKEPWF